MKDIRVRFKKTGRAKYISHLDLTRTMTRAIRRAGLPIWYTEGFNRHPYITFAAPLSLGFEGNAESMDFRIVEEISMEEIVSRLASVLPEGLEVYAAGEPLMKVAEIASAEYQLLFLQNAELMPEFLVQESICSQKRTKKGKIKEINLKPYLEKVVITHQNDLLMMDILLPCGSEENINPMLIVKAYQEFIMQRTEVDRPVFCNILRLQVLNKNGQPFA